MLDTPFQNLNSEKTTISLDDVKAVLISKKSKTTAKVAGVSQLALILAACGSDSTTSSSSSSTLLSLTKSGDNYSASSVTGFALNSQTVATLDVADSSTNAYAIELDASGTGTLHFDFADAGDTVTLNAGSKVAGFTTLKVSDGTIDATNADLSSITRVEVASGIKITLAQIKTIPTVVSNSASGKIEVEVATEAEATELVSLLTAGTVQVFGAANPIDMVASETATVTASVLTEKVAETTTTLKPVTDAPAVSTDTTTDTTTDTATDTATDTTPAAPVSTVEEAVRFTMSGDASGNYTPGFYNGNVTVTASGNDYIVTPASGGAIQTPTADVNSFVVSGITMSGDAVVLDGETITGTGNVAITKLEGDAAADLSLITVTGTRTATVSDDVTFTGNLGTFTTTVNSGKTLTGDVAVLQGKTINGAGTTAVTDLDTDLDADLSGITSTTHTATFNNDGTFTGDLGTAATTIASGKTMTAATGVVSGKSIAGAGNLSITGMVNATDVSSIATSGTITVAGVTTAANLTALDAVTTTAIAATAITTITGSVAEVKAAAAAAGITTASDYAATLSDAAATAITITDLSTIGSDTTGTVTVSNAIATSGTKDQITAAFVTSGSKVVASSAAVAITTDTTITATDVETFETAVGALNLGSAVTVTIAAAASADFEATTVSGDTIAINGTGDDAGETLTITGAATAQTIDLSNVTIDTDDIAVVNIDGGAATDTITGSNGVDKITGGGGVDIITITGSSKDDVVLASATADYDDITGFASGSDADDLVTLDSVFGFAQGSTDGTIVMGKGDEVDDALTGSGTGDADATLLVLNDDFATADILDMIIAGTKTGAEVIAEAVTAMGATTKLADTEKVLVAIDDTEDTALFWVQQDSTAGILASEVTLLAVLQGTTADLVANDFVVS